MFLSIPKQFNKDNYKFNNLQKIFYLGDNYDRYCY